MQILGYILQRLDPDQTTNMPQTLPPDFFIPDADYDAATRDTGDERARGLDQTPEAPSAVLLRDLDAALKKSNASTKTMNAVRDVVKKDFDVLAAEVAARALSMNI